MLLVLDCVIKGLAELFSVEEVEIYNKYKACDTLAQTLFARMISRKRVWYVVDDHLSNYAPDKVVEGLKEKDLEKLQNAVN